MEQMLRLLHASGLPASDVDFLQSDGITMNQLLLEVGRVSLASFRAFKLHTGGVVLQYRKLRCPASSNIII